MTVCAVLASLVPILWESGIGSDVIKPIAAPIVGRHDYLDHSRPNPCARILRHDEGAGIAQRSSPRAESNRQSHSTLNSRRTLMRLRIPALFFSLVLSTVVASAQSSQTLTGTVSDAMCGAHHMMQGASAAQCTRECIKRGSDFTLVGGDKVYTLKGGETQLDKFAGQNVTIKGK
jgi:hypothetical protein